MAFSTGAGRVSASSMFADSGVWPSRMWASHHVEIAAADCAR